MKKMIDMNNEELKRFLLKDSSYFNLELPPYYKFNGLLIYIDNKIKDKKELKDLCSGKKRPNNYEDVNYKLFYNKDGKFDWRPIELINPILYVYLVNLISEKNNWKELKKIFKKFQKNKKIICCSIPVESYDRNSDKKEGILNWWNRFEQSTIEKSLSFNCMAITDITNCYGSIYTHSIIWAINGKKNAKENKKQDNLGNEIDKVIMAMSYGQTNGIPQGSILMDFIAEIILGYADYEIGNKLKKKKIVDYSILRFRDDYRIFAKNEFDLKRILKIITEVLIELNFKLNSNKTLITDDIITNSIKKDKENVLVNNYIVENSIQKSLYNIRKLSILYPNSGSISKLLTKLYEEQIKKEKKEINYLGQIISILVDIMYRNPRTYAQGTMILSYILNPISEDDKEKYVKLILQKFSNIPNTNYLEIWLQRMLINTNIRENFQEILCEKIYKKGDKIKIWNNEWTNLEIDENLIIDYSKIANINPIIEEKEVNPFVRYYN